MRNAKTAMLNMHVTVTLDTPVMAIHVLILTNVLPVSHHVTSIQPVLTKREVTSEHVTQVLKAPDMLAMIFTSAKTNHVTQMATTKTLSDHSDVLVKMDFRMINSTVLISTNVILVHITVPARKDTLVTE